MTPSGQTAGADDGAAGAAVAVIPARFASTRFPGKPLANETGRPLIQHVYERASAARRVGRVIVATDDTRIFDAVRAFGGEAVMTRADHPNGTSRIAEVAAGLEAQVIVNVQGDEPEIEPGVIDLAVDVLGEAPMSTVASPFAEGEDPRDPNVVKVVLNRAGRALYFSRAPIPFDRMGTGISPLKHVGLYVYRRAFLFEYVAMEPTPLELAEGLEQLRVLEHGRPIAVAVTATRHVGIDTPEQYRAFVQRWRRAGRAT